MLGLPASVKAPALAATGGSAVPQLIAPWGIEVTSVINIPASGGRRRLVYQIYPPAIDTLVTGMTHPSVGLWSPTGGWVSGAGRQHLVFIDIH